MPENKLKKFRCLNDECRKPIAPVRRGALVFNVNGVEIEVFPKKAMKIKCPFCKIHSLFKQEENT
jgi:hypothetical protein